MRGGRICRGGLATRGVALAALAAVAISSFGVPLPAVVSHRAGERFPCEACLCGCPDAESCWRDCCCHTNLEKVDWAIKNGVTPPRFVLAAARREQAQVQLAHFEEPGGQVATTSAAQCTHGCDQACADSPHITLAPSASRGLIAGTAQPQTLGLGLGLGRSCSKTASCTRAPHCARCLAAKQPAPRRAVTFVAAMRCRGISISVCLLPPSLPVEIPRFNLAPPDHVDCILLSRALYASPTFDVATPPPDAVRC